MGARRTTGGDVFAITVNSDGHGAVPVLVSDGGNGGYALTFVPTHAGLHTVTVTHRGQALCHSPRYVTVVDRPFAHQGGGHVSESFTPTTGRHTGTRIKCEEGCDAIFNQPGMALPSFMPIHRSNSLLNGKEGGVLMVAPLIANTARAADRMKTTYSTGRNSMRASALHFGAVKTVVAPRNGAGRLATADSGGPRESPRCQLNLTVSDANPLFSYIGGHASEILTAPMEVALLAMFPDKPTSLRLLHDSTRGVAPADFNNAG